MKRRRNNFFISFVICFLLITNLSNAQYSFFNSKVNWKELEKSIPINIKKEEISKLADDLIIYLKGNKLLEKNFSNFHFLDYDMDGATEIVFCGDAGTTSKRTLIFKHDENGKYIKIFDKFGVIISVLQPDRIIPPTFVLKEDPCCGDNNIIYQVYQLVFLGDKQEFQLATTYCTVRGTYVPSEFIRPFLVELIADSPIRLTPTADDSIMNTDLNIKGNSIANYPRKAKGFVIAKSTDKKGISWFFILMVSNIEPTNSILHNSSNDNKKYFSIGWMNSMNTIKEQ